MNRQDTGRLGESLALDFLEEQGYHILETNYRCPHGEVDIIAQDEDCLVFIEVRTRKSNSFGSPEESITPRKKAHLVDTAWHYQQSLESLPRAWRIDFIAIELSRGNRMQRVELIKSAVGEE